MNRKRRVVARLHPRCDEEAGLSCLSDMCGDILAGEPGSEHGGGLFGRERATCAASHYSAFRRCGIPRPSADCATPWACCQPAARWRIRRVSAGASPPLRRPTQCGMTSSISRLNAWNSLTFALDANPVGSLRCARWTAWWSLRSWSMRQSWNSSVHPWRCIRGRRRRRCPRPVPLHAAHVRA